jgi:hypothetical protein
MTMPIDSRTAVLFYDGDVYSPAFECGQCIDLLELADIAALNANQLHNSEENVYFADEQSQDAVTEFLSAHSRLLTTEAGQTRIHPPGTLLVDGELNKNEVIQWCDAPSPVSLSLSFLRERNKRKNKSQFREASTSPTHDKRQDLLDAEKARLEVGKHFLSDIGHRLRFSD